VPGKGGTVRALTIAYSPPPPGKEENQYWQELEKRLGVTYEVILAPQATYGEQTAAILAGGDLPDLFYINPGQGAFHLNQAIQQGAFADLTDYLNDEGRQQFPNLNLIPADMWKNVAIGGKIYGVPKPTQLHNNLPFFRADWARKVGLPQPENREQFRQMVVAFSKNDPDANGQADTFGIMSTGAFFHTEIIEEMHRVPNTWRLSDDGTLTHQIETDEYREALDFMRQLWAEGVYHPDSPALEWARVSDMYLSGTFGINAGGYSPHFGLNGDRGRIKVLDTPEAELLGLVPFDKDGGPGISHNLTGFFGFTAIPSSIGGDEERVLELLNILNYLTAPFGSEEHTFLSYGLEGVHHTVDAEGARALNEKGEQERSDLVYYADINESFHFYPGVPGEAEYAQDLAEQTYKIGIDNPVLGLVSQTEQSRGPEIDQLNRDRIIAIVTGREPLEAIDQWLNDWRSRGGDQIRQEYQQALQQQ
jgi:putative aldouronate transport system substrate-binding protein